MVVLETKEDGHLQELALDSKEILWFFVKIPFLFPKTLLDISDILFTVNL